MCVRAGILVAVFGAVVLWGQATASLSGSVNDSQGVEVARAVVLLRNALTGYLNRTETAGDGTFAIGNIPFQDYVLVVSKPGFAPRQQTVALRTNVPVEVNIALSIEGVQEQVSVTAFAKGQLVD